MGEGVRESPAAGFIPFSHFPDRLLIAEGVLQNNFSLQQQQKEEREGEEGDELLHLLHQFAGRSRLEAGEGGWGWVTPLRSDVGQSNKGLCSPWREKSLQRDFFWKGGSIITCLWL